VVIRHIDRDCRVFEIVIVARRETEAAQVFEIAANGTGKGTLNRAVNVGGGAAITTWTWCITSWGLGWTWCITRITT
jgi:hypothetical protein